MTSNFATGHRIRSQQPRPFAAPSLARRNARSDEIMKIIRMSIIVMKVIIVIRKEVVIIITIIVIIIIIVIISADHRLR